jgi:hypothetical protein
LFASLTPNYRGERNYGAGHCTDHSARRHVLPCCRFVATVRSPLPVKACLSRGNTRSWSWEMRSGEVQLTLPACAGCRVRVEVSESYGGYIFNSVAELHVQYYHKLFSVGTYVHRVPHVEPKTSKSLDLDSLVASSSLLVRSEVYQGQDSTPGRSTNATACAPRACFPAMCEGE